MTTKYRAYATISYDLVCEFEVKDGQDAWEVARDLDGGLFKEIDNSSDWKVFDIEPIETLTKEDQKIIAIRQINEESNYV